MRLRLHQCTACFAHDYLWKTRTCSNNCFGLHYSNGLGPGNQIKVAVMVFSGLQLRSGQKDGGDCRLAAKPKSLHGLGACIITFIKRGPTAKLVAL